MSIPARYAVANNSKMNYRDTTQKPDLLNEYKTNTWLIQMLEDLLQRTGEPLMIMAIRTDHETPDGPWAHSGGCAIDLYPKNWEGREEEAVVNVLRALAANPYCEAVGLGGVTQQWFKEISWPTDHFVKFNDNSSDHIHCGCANAVDPPGARSNFQVITP